MAKRSKLWRTHNASILADKRVACKSKKRHYLAIVKNNPCNDCGITFHLEAMTFDHLPEFEKTYDIYRLVNHPTADLNKLKLELLKCELVCVGCHRDRTRLRTPEYVRSCRFHRPVRQSGCKKCTHANSLINMKLARVHHISMIKSTPCADCQKTFDPWKMDFDHLQGKHDGVSNLVGSQASWTRILEEISKCEVVCCWCHVLRTVSRRRGNSRYVE